MNERLKSQFYDIKRSFREPKERLIKVSNNDLLELQVTLDLMHEAYLRMETAEMLSDHEIRENAGYVLARGHELADALLFKTGLIHYVDVVKDNEDLRLQAKPEFFISHTTQYQHIGATDNVLRNHTFAISQCSPEAVKINEHANGQPTVLFSAYSNLIDYPDSSLSNQG